MKSQKKTTQYIIQTDKRSFNMNNDFQQVKNGMNVKDKFCESRYLDLIDWNVEFIFCNNKDTVVGMYDEKLKTIVDFIDKIKKKHSGISSNNPIGEDKFFNISEKRIRNKVDIMNKMMKNYIVFVFSKKKYAQTSSGSQLVNTGEKTIEGVAICYQYKKMLYVSDFFTMYLPSKSKILSVFPAIVLSKMPFVKYIMLCITKDMYPLYRRRQYKLYKKPKVDNLSSLAATTPSTINQNTTTTYLNQSDRIRRQQQQRNAATSSLKRKKEQNLKDNTLAVYFAELNALGIIYPKLISSKLCVEDDETNQQIQKIGSDNCKKMKRRYATCNTDENNECNCLFIYLKIEKN